MIDLPALRQLASPAPREVEVARCELCGSPLGASHRHVLELEPHALLCACQPCGILFARGDSLARFRTVPARVMTDPTFELSWERWTELGIPVGLVFFVHQSQPGRTVACYPGPAGITEGVLEPGVWDEIAAATSLVEAIEDDVEALLVHRERGAARASCFLIPITDAYELAGRLRQCWSGFSGGDEARRVLAGFLADLRRRGSAR